MVYCQRPENELGMEKRIIRSKDSVEASTGSFRTVDVASAQRGESSDDKNLPVYSGNPLPGEADEAMELLGITDSDE